jgi:hypothetical protein
VCTRPPSCGAASLALGCQSVGFRLQNKREKCQPEKCQPCAKDTSTDAEAAAKAAASAAKKAEAVTQAEKEGGKPLPMMKKCKAGWEGLAVGCSQKIPQRKKTKIYPGLCYHPSATGLVMRAEP